MIDVPIVSHYFVIKVYDKHRNILECLKWDKMTFELRMKYDWYFKYRAALLQVKYPKLKVETYWGNEPSTGKVLRNQKENKIRAKKAKITEYQNKYAKYKSEYDSLWGIDDDIIAVRYDEKIRSLKIELELMIEDLNNDNA